MRWRGGVASGLGMVMRGEARLAEGMGLGGKLPGPIHLRSRTVTSATVTSHATRAHDLGELASATDQLHNIVSVALRIPPNITERTPAIERPRRRNRFHS